MTRGPSINHERAQQRIGEMLEYTLFDYDYNCKIHLLVRKLPKNYIQEGLKKKHIIEN